LALSVTITLALLVLIGLPLGAILPQKYVVQLPINVLVPLYIDPTAGGWERLCSSAIKHGETNFTIIINPSNGPGTTTWPAGPYIEAIQRLNKLSNVQTVGYIDTERGTRDSAAVRKEIETYAGWNQSKIAISGIFFNNTPYEEWEHGQRKRGAHTMWSGTAESYLQNVTATVRQAQGLLEPKLVLHSPGRVPQVSLTSAHVDLTVVFEGTYTELPSKTSMREKLKALGGRREKYAYLVYDVPKEISRGGIRRIVDGMRRNAAWLFVTSLGGD
ncbi:hypothetical protein P280DRAFT_360715, partial [Massarina eburnea CBS 473.64]